MNFAVLFNLALTVLTAVTGILWLLDRFWLAPRRVAAGGPALPGPVYEFFRGLFPVIAAVFVVRSFLFEPFRIPSGSMIPTLHIGDFILVNKFGYGLRCPVGDCKLVDIGEPKRGDVVVFKWPKDTRMDFIKRVIGIPGDRIRYVDKVLTVNDETVALAEAGLYADDGIIERRHEDFGGVKHDILVNPQAPPRDFEFTVPPGEYFMMGDNRDGSNDSRFWGTVPEANLKGRAVLIWMSWNSDKLRPELSRIGTLIR